MSNKIYILVETPNNLVEVARFERASKVYPTSSHSQV